MSLWEETKSRLRNLMNGVAGPDEGLLQLRADIRAALERISDLENACMVHHDEVARLVIAEAEAMALVLNHEGAIARLTRERDEAREVTDLIAAEVVPQGFETVLDAVRRVCHERDAAKEVVP